MTDIVQEIETNKQNFPQSGNDFFYELPILDEDEVKSKSIIQESKTEAETVVNVYIQKNLNEEKK